MPVASALLLGLTGSLGHCLGMCGGVAVLLARRNPPWPVHLGRLASYAFLGAMAGGLGQGITTALPGLRAGQGLLALAAGVFTVYAALALTGRLPPPDRLAAPVLPLWGRVFRRASASRRAGLLTSVGAGLLWGLLPCGLVWTGLALAAASASSPAGAAVMGAFGLGTLPALLLAGRSARQASGRGRWARPLAAVLMLLIGAQMTLRGLAFWGWVPHLRVGVAIW